MRTETIRAAVRRFTRNVPFQPFILNMENGDRVVVEHPENIAFDPVAEKPDELSSFYVISGPLHVSSTFEAVTSVTVADREGLANQE